MTLADLLLALALGLPRHSSDASESLDDRSARLANLAAAVDDAAATATCDGDRDPECKPAWPGSHAELSALLLAVAWHESAFARNVHAGRCHAWQCDNGRARSPWQLHVSGLVPRDEWRSMGSDSADATAIGAQAAARVLAWGRIRCGSVEGALAAYATGRSCRWSGAAPRLHTFRRLLAKLEG